MNIKRRTVLKGLAAAAIAAAVPATTLPWSQRLLDARVTVVGWPPPEEYVLCIPHYTRGTTDPRTWLEMIIEPSHVPNLGAPMLVELKEFGMVFDGDVTNIEPVADSENFKVTVVEAMRRDDI